MVETHNLVATHTLLGTLATELLTTIVTSIRASIVFTTRPSALFTNYGLLRVLFH